MEMKMLKLVFVIVVLLVVKVLTTPLNAKINDEPLSQVIALEESCVRQGGICMRSEDCDPSTTAQIGTILCPKQYHMGVVCCYQ